MTDKIPDDVMKAAYVVRRRCEAHIRTDGMSFYLDDACDEIIGRAIMAEIEQLRTELTTARKFLADGMTLGTLPESTHNVEFLARMDAVLAGKGGAA